MSERTGPGAAYFLVARSLSPLWRAGGKNPCSPEAIEISMYDRAGNPICGITMAFGLRVVKGVLRFAW